MRIVVRDHFVRDGRGPELLRTHYSPSGATLLAADYCNPDGEKSKDTRHLRFVAAQVFMFTPEEVGDVGPFAEVERGAAAVCLGRSAWLRSFDEHHLEKCEYYRLMFYDEYLDVICEGIETGEGPYVPSNHALERAREE